MAENGETVVAGDSSDPRPIKKAVEQKPHKVSGAAADFFAELAAKNESMMSAANSIKKLK